MGNPKNLNMEKSLEPIVLKNPEEVKALMDAYVSRQDYLRDKLIAAVN